MIPQPSHSGASGELVIKRRLNGVDVNQSEMNAIAAVDVIFYEQLKNGKDDIEPGNRRSPSNIDSISPLLQIDHSDNMDDVAIEFP